MSQLQITETCQSVKANLSAEMKFWQVPRPTGENTLLLIEK